MFFDYYSATVREDQVTYDLDGFVDEVAAALDGQRVADKPRHGYAEGAVIRRDGDVVARVLYGGRNRWPCVTGSGVHTEGVVDLLRGRYAHEVTRIDSSFDLDEPDAFGNLVSVAEGVANERGVMIRRIEGELAGKSRGRTVYVGSNKSPVQLRIYEKGHEQRGKAITTAQAEKYSLDWVRSELQVRPEKGARAAASGWQPEEAWGHPGGRKTS